MRINTWNIAHEANPPDRCPICHFGIEPEECGSRLAGRDVEGPPHQIVYRCPRAACGHFFVALYKKNPRAHHPRDGYPRASLERLWPIVPRRPPVPVEVRNVSSRFVDVYSQASAAEAHGLGDVAGGGYRKALEILVKDYCVHLSPESEKEIEGEWLGKVIQDRVDDGNVRECAKRATWLGNDETHYARRWTEHDLQDLKRLLSLTVNWVSSALVTQRYIDELPEE